MTFTEERIMKLKQLAPVMRVQYIGSPTTVHAEEVTEPIARNIYALPNTSFEDLLALGRIFEKLGRENFVHRIVTTKQTLVK
jgi:hypothetical protein